MASNLILRQIFKQNIHHCVKMFTRFLMVLSFSIYILPTQFQNTKILTHANSPNHQKCVSIKSLAGRSREKSAYVEGTASTSSMAKECPHFLPALQIVHKDPAVGILSRNFSVVTCTRYTV